MQETIRVIQPGKRRVKIFVDFWNLMINARKQTSSAFDLTIKWDLLASFLTREASGGYSDEATSELAGCYIFGSYVKSDASQQKLIEKVLDEYGSKPGLFFSFSDRIKKESSIKCSKCGSSMATSSESGVDVLLCVEMIKHAAMKEHEYLALVSNDRDFLPMMSFLKDRGERVIHAATGDTQREMRAITWKQIDIKDNYAHLCQISNFERIILTEPSASVRLEQAVSIMTENDFAYKAIDITNKDEISDKDLDFIFRNQSIMFRKKDADPRMTFGPRKLTGSISTLRDEIRRGNIHTGLPYVFYKGQMEARADEQWNWVVAGENVERWQKFRRDPRRR